MQYEESSHGAVALTNRLLCACGPERVFPSSRVCTPLLRAGGRSLSVRDRAWEGLVMSCAENGGSIPTNGGAVSRRVREEASSDAPFGPFFG